MEHKLPELGYAHSALAPHISEETMQLHHTKHHQTYVTKLNALIKGTEYENMGLEELVQKAPAGPIFNNGGQHWNHCEFWKMLAPNGGGEPQGNLADAIARDFGGLDQFKEAFETCGANTFGAGWAWLAQNTDGKLELMSCSNADNPLRNGKNALFGVDVWEHAYYVDYRNRRPEYLQHIWNLVNWEYVAQRMK